VSAFIARVTPGDIHRGDGATGRYTRMADAVVEIEGREPMTRTAMCFGQANSAITRRLASGRPLSLLCEWKGRSLLVVGWPPKG
jgi:hypothetical protein